MFAKLSDFSWMMIAVFAPACRSAAVNALVVVTRLTQIRAASVDIHQRVMRGAEILTEAEVTAALVGASGKPKLHGKAKPQGAKAKAGSPRGRAATIAP